MLPHFNKMISEEYGRKKGWLLCGYYSLIDYFGVFKKYRNIDWNRVNRLIFVCAGNICRSPYADMRCKLSGIDATSFGLNADDGSSADYDAARISSKLGVDLSLHKSKTQKNIQLRTGDLLIGMEPCHAKRLDTISAQYDTQVTLVGLWCKKERPYIQDPFGLSDEYFSNCFGYIDNGIDGILLNMKKAGYVPKRESDSQ